MLAKQGVETAKKKSSEFLFRKPFYVFHRGELCTPVNRAGLYCMLSVLLNTRITAIIRYRHIIVLDTLTFH
jgi:hypothetical protein